MPRREALPRLFNIAGVLLQEHAVTPTIISVSWHGPIRGIAPLSGLPLWSLVPDARFWRFTRHHGAGDCDVHRPVLLPTSRP